MDTCPRGENEEVKTALQVYLLQTYSICETKRNETKIECLALCDAASAVALVNLAELLPAFLCDSNIYESRALCRVSHGCSLTPIMSV